LEAGTSRNKKDAPKKEEIRKRGREWGTTREIKIVSMTRR
jgi:hypothetical protein